MGKYIHRGKLSFFNSLDKVILFVLGFVAVGAYDTKVCASQALCTGVEQPSQEQCVDSGNCDWGVPSGGGNPTCLPLSDKSSGCSGATSFTNDCTTPSQPKCSCTGSSTSNCTYTWQDLQGESGRQEYSDVGNGCSPTAYRCKQGFYGNPAQQSGCTSCGNACSGTCGGTGATTSSNGGANAIVEINACYIPANTTCNESDIGTYTMLDNCHCG